MAEEDKNSSPLDEGTEIIAHTAQTAYATTAAVAAGGTAAGMAAGVASGATQQEDASGWTCECGQKNTGKFCSNCGKPRA